MVRGWFDDDNEARVCPKGATADEAGLGMARANSRAPTTTRPIAPDMVLWPSILRFDSACQQKFGTLNSGQLGLGVKGSVGRRRGVRGGEGKVARDWGCKGSRGP